MSGGLQRPGDLEFEYRLVHPDGSIHWVLSRGHTYFDESGRPVRRTGIGVDMTGQVLFITGYAENAAVFNGHLEPGMELLTKPFTMQGLAAKVAEMMKGGADVEAPT